jgi:hypothetical protein
MALYKNVRDTIKSGDILAWSHRSWGSFYDLQVQAVRFATQSEYCHVGTAWVVAGRVFVIEAVTPKVRIYPLSKLLPFYLIKLDGNWTMEAEEFALAQVGMDYSKLQAIESFFRLPKADNLWQCAELTAAIARHNGLMIGKKVTPSALVEEVLKNAAGLMLVEEE